ADAEEETRKNNKMAENKTDENGPQSDVDSTNEPFASLSVQTKVKDAIRMLEETTRVVARLDLFSRNETVDELSTADLRFLLLPALLGALTMKRSGQDQRLDTVRTARVYYMDYLRRCRDYDLATFQMPGNTELSEEGETQQCTSAPPSSDLVAMAAQRQAKIDRYRKKKEVESRLSAMRQAVESGQAEDEVCREFYILNIRRWITVCLEEIESIDQELPILQNMDVLKENAPKQKSGPHRAPMKPFILTKDSIKAQVFGAGYPSLATMTVDDWYEQHQKRGVLPDQGLPRNVPVEDGDAKEREEEEKERKCENDDEESLTKARNWDDWKDNHPRGYGNRHNMG
uniref:Immunoglobulin (CD79A) binding protein 1 n=1 Tax=Gouania willdenowi TaxID=441366 RepID=A0A8C5NA84_GOUWI